MNISPYLNIRSDLIKSKGTLCQATVRRILKSLLSASDETGLRIIFGKAYKARVYEAITGELRYARTGFENVKKVLLRNYNRSFDVIA